MSRHRIISVYGLAVDYCIVDFAAMWEVSVNVIYVALEESLNDANRLN